VSSRYSINSATPAASAPPTIAARITCENPLEPIGAVGTRASSTISSELVRRWSEVIFDENWAIFDEVWIT